MTFVIYGGYSKSKAEKLEKILRSLYGSVEVILMNSKPSTSAVNINAKDGYKLFSVSGGKESKLLYDNRVLSISFDEQNDKVIYDIITFVGSGVSEKSVIKALALAK